MSPTSDELAAANLEVIARRSRIFLVPVAWFTLGCAAVSAGLGHPASWGVGCSLSAWMLLTWPGLRAAAFPFEKRPAVAFVAATWCGAWHVAPGAWLVYRYGSDIASSAFWLSTMAVGLQGAALYLALVTVYTWPLSGTVALLLCSVALPVAWASSLAIHPALGVFVGFVAATALWHTANPATEAR